MASALIAQTPTIATANTAAANVQLAAFICSSPHSLSRTASRCPLFASTQHIYAPVQFMNPCTDTPYGRRTPSFKPPRPPSPSFDLSPTTCEPPCTPESRTNTQAAARPTPTASHARAPPSHRPETPPPARNAPPKTTRPSGYHAPIPPTRR